VHRLRAGGAWQDHGLIFCRDDGRPWNPDYVSRRFRRLAAEAGVPTIKLHDGGRHTGNSLMRDAEVSQEVRMRAVGHSDRSVNDRYTHVPDRGTPDRRRADRGAGPQGWRRVVKQASVPLVFSQAAA